MIINKTDKNNIDLDYSASEATPYSQDIDYFTNLMKYIPNGSIYGFVPPTPVAGGYFTDASNIAAFTAKYGYEPSPLPWSLADVNKFLACFNCVVCDGTIYNNTKSPIYNYVLGVDPDRYLPDLTDDVFLMGSTTAGSPGGSNFLADHPHVANLQTMATAAISRSCILSTHGHSTTSDTLVYSHTDSTGNNHQIRCGNDFDDGGSYLVWNHVSGAYAYVSVGHMFHLHPWTSTVGSEYVNFKHSHLADFSSLHVGTGPVPNGSNIDNKPSFLKCYFIQKVCD